MKNLLKILLAVLLASCLIVDGVYFYFYSYVITGIHGSTFVGSIDSDGKTPFVEVLYKTSDNGVGVQSFEIRFNNLSDINHKEIVSYGVQIFNPKPRLNQVRYTSNFRYYYEESLTDNPYFYNSTGSISFTATSKLRDNSGFLVTIDDKLYILQMSNKEVFLKMSGLFNWGSDYTVYNYSTFITRLFNACQSLEYGTYKNLCLVYDDFFNVLEYSEETKRFDKQVTDTALVDSIVKNYVFCKVVKSSEGLTDKSQSMFNCVFGDNKLNVGGWNYD